MSWLFKPKKIVTMDIGSHTIKLGEFTFKGKNSKPYLNNFALLEIPDGCIKDGDVIDPEPIKESLPDFIVQNTDPPLSDISVAIGGRSIIVKKLEILTADRALMDDLVQEEVSQSLPFSLDEINYDYAPMTVTDLATDEGKTNILLAVAKKDSVYKVEQMLEGSGCNCKSIDMEAFAIAECVKFIDPKASELGQTTMILDIGRCGTLFVVLKQGEVIFARYLSIGGDTYTSNLSSDMKIDYQEAESLKISWRDKKEAPPEVSRSMKESDIYFCDEITSGLEYFKHQFPEEQFSKIYVTGGGSKSQSLIQALSETFKTPVKLLDPLEALEVSDFLQDSLEHMKYFSSVIVGMFFRAKEGGK